MQSRQGSSLNGASGRQRFILTGINPRPTIRMRIDQPRRINVVAALIFRNGRLLVAQRKESDLFPLKWEFPGGKIKAREGRLKALKRELKEELGIEVQTARQIYRHKHVYPNPLEVDLTFFRVEAYKGRIQNRIFRRLRWAKPVELQELDFLEGDLPLVKKIARRERLDSTL